MCISNTAHILWDIWRIFFFEDSCVIVVKFAEIEAWPHCACPCQPNYVKRNWCCKNISIKLAGDKANWRWILNFLRSNTLSMDELWQYLDLKHYWVYARCRMTGKAVYQLSGIILPWNFSCCWVALGFLSLLYSTSNKKRWLQASLLPVTVLL